MFSYRVGAFGWRLAARLGFTLRVQVRVLFDHEANVFVAETDDFMPQFGCVVEAETWEELERKLYSVFDEAVETVFNKPSKSHAFKPVLYFA